LLFERGALQEVILIKSAEELALIRQACHIVAQALEALRAAVAPGVSTKELEAVAEEHIRRKGATPAFKGYRGYPASICTSVNDQVVHGIPAEGVRLKEGDIVSIDLGACYRGYYGDAAVTLPVGRISPQAQRLLRVTQEALELALQEATEGRRVGDISWAIQSHVEKEGFSVVRAFVGHGVGRYLHEEPQVPNFGPPGRGPRLRAGMTLAIEPMVNAGHWGVRILQDGWTAVTADGTLSAHFEHTVLIRKDGPEVLTKLQ
jgi:methionyl aminopeptidase